jgi:hypothetical protein
MARQRIKYQQIVFKVNAPNEVVSSEVETDRLYKKITGINVVLSGDIKNKFSVLKLDIDSVEIFPTGFEVLRLLFRESVPFGFDYNELNEKAEGSRIKYEYGDVAPNPVPLGLYPYTVIISLRLENDKVV